MFSGVDLFLFFIPFTKNQISSDPKTEAGNVVDMPLDRIMVLAQAWKRFRNASNPAVSRDHFSSTVRVSIVKRILCNKKI